jgi:hypothetical protein
VTWFITVLMLVSALETSGQQALLYGTVFCAPMALAALALPHKGPLPAALGWTLGALGAALMLSMPVLLAMWEHANSSDAGRTLGDQDVIHSVAAWTLDEAARSLLLHPFLSEPVLHLQEKHYAFGATLTLATAALLSHRRALVLLWLGTLLAFLFALGLEPISSWLVRAVPPLAAFRVPSRVMLPLLLVGQLVALTFLEAPVRDGDRRTGLLLLAALLLPLLLPDVAREVTAWLAVSTVLWGRAQRRAASVATVAMFVLAGCTLGAFRSQLRPYAPESAMVERPRAVGMALQENNPELARPLTRVTMSPEAVRQFGPNAAVIFGLEAVEGYGHAPRRFGRMWSALSGVSHDLTNVMFLGDPTSPVMRVLALLYNVRFGISVAPPGWRRLSETCGSAWLSSEIREVTDLAALATELNRAVEETGTLPNAVLVAAHDHKTRSWPALDCGDLGVASVETTASLQDSLKGGLRVILKGNTRSRCILVMALNYLDVIDAVDSSTAGRLRSFPANGTLMGVVLEPNTREVILRSRAPSPLGPFCTLVGAVAALLPMLWIPRRRKHTPGQSHQSCTEHQENKLKSAQ